MRYIALLAIFAAGFAAPAPEHQVVMDTPATYNEHDGNSPHVEVNVYLNGAEKEELVVDTSSGFRCFYCGNQATNDLRTTAVCNTAGGKIKSCGSKEDGVACTNSKFTKDQFARECGIVGCISAVQTCSTSSKFKNQEETSVFNTGDPAQAHHCYDCGSPTLDDLRTRAVCRKFGGSDTFCGSKGPMSCTSSKLNKDEFAKECGIAGCRSAAKTCSSSSSQFEYQEETPTSGPKESGRYCDECGSQTLNDKVTEDICDRSDGDTQLCGRKGPISCMNSKLSDEAFGGECHKNNCKAVVQTCKSSSQSNYPEGAFVSNVNNSPRPPRSCSGCGSVTLDDLRTKMVCCEFRGDTQLCGNSGPYSCANAHISNELFQKECAKLDCKGFVQSCTKKTLNDQGLYLNEL